MNGHYPTLRRLALLAQGRPNLLAWPLALYQDQEGLDEQQLATRIGCSTDALFRLALCERPRPAPHFREDVERIAQYIQADMLKLATVIRAAESREALWKPSGNGEHMLLAARDHEDDRPDE